MKISPQEIEENEITEKDMTIFWPSVADLIFFVRTLNQAISRDFRNELGST